MSDDAPATVRTVKQILVLVNDRLAEIPEPPAPYLATSAIADVSGGKTTVTGPDGNGLYTIVKASGGDDWNASAVSAAAMLKDAVVQIVAPANIAHHTMMGLSYAPNVSDGYDDLSFAFYFQSGGGLIFYESNANVATIGTWAAGETFWITQSSDGTKITYWRGATLEDAVPIRSTATTFAPLYFDSCLYSVGATLKAGLFRRRSSI